MLRVLAILFVLIQTAPACRMVAVQALPQEQLGYLTSPAEVNGYLLSELEI